MENENINIVRITVDLPQEVADFLLKDAKENDRIRKNHIEYILKQYWKSSKDRTEA